MRIVFVCLLMLSTHAKGEVAVNIDHEFYPVKVAKASELLTELNRLSPIREGGDIFHGVTDAHISWRFWWNEENGKCRIDRVTTTVDIKHTLPRLESADPESGLMSIWNKWYPALIEHEKGHAITAIQIAHEIDASILLLPEYQSCKALTRDANETGHRLLDKLRQMDREYDEKTDHGKTQGASLFLYL